MTRGEGGKGLGVENESTVSSHPRKLPNELQRYADFAPAVGDPSGLNAARMGFDGGDRSGWGVAFGRNRDSGTLDESNWAAGVAALEETGAEGEGWEIHSFGHWAVGWLEIVIVEPESQAAAVAIELATRLADYPVLDEEDYSRREWEEASEYWAAMSLSDRVTLCQECGVSGLAARHDSFPNECFEALTRE